MLTPSDLNKHGFPTDLTIEGNMISLCHRIDKLLEVCPLPINSDLVTSGLRSMADHIRIYAQKGIPKDKVPMKSKHLIGAAVDISDPNGDLYRWCDKNQATLKWAGLYMEADTKGWVHLQWLAPASGKTKFNA